MRKIFWLLLVICSCCNAITCYDSILIKTGDEERPVTRIHGQLFYQSTGQNSQLEGVFFPFYGILSYKDSKTNLPFWFIKPGAGDYLTSNQFSANMKSQFYNELTASGTDSDIWDSYWYSNFGLFLDDTYKVVYIKEKLSKSKTMFRLGGLDNAKTSYRITNSLFSENVRNEIIGPLNTYFVNNKIEKDLFVNTKSPIKTFEVPIDTSFTVYNEVAHQINNYIKSSSSDWYCT